MSTLRQAREQGKLDQFAAEHDADAPGDEEAFNRAFQSMAGTSKAVPEASSTRMSQFENGAFSVSEIANPQPGHGRFSVNDRQLYL